MKINTKWKIAAAGKVLCQKNGYVTNVFLCRAISMQLTNKKIIWSRGGIEEIPFLKN